MDRASQLIQPDNYSYIHYRGRSRFQGGQGQPLRILSASPGQTGPARYQFPIKVDSVKERDGPMQVDWTLRNGKEMANQVFNPINP